MRDSTVGRAVQLAALALALLPLPGCATVWQGITPQGPPGETESARRLRPGPWKVEREDLRLVDASRPTPAYGANRGAPDRTLETSVWFPRDAPGPSPIAIYSHGFLSERREADYLARHLASHGWVVASADFPLSNRRTADDPTLLDVVNQPGDVRFLIDWLLGSGEAPLPSNAFVGRVDPERIAAVGLSLGGLTSTLVAFHPELRDPRVGAAVSIAGPVFLLTERLFQSAPVPFLMIASTDDAIVDYASNGAVLLERAPNAVRLSVRGASHAGFAGISATVFRFWPNPDSVGCWYLKRQLDVDPNELASLESLDGGGGWVELPEIREIECRAPWWRRTMRPRRQHAIAKLAVRAFLEAKLAEEPAVREAARRFLTVSLASDLEDVELSGGKPT